MKKHFLTFLIFTSLICSNIFGQEIKDKIYYKDYTIGYRTGERKAKYVQITYKDNFGLTKSEVINKKTNEVVFSFRYSDSLFKDILEYDVKSKTLVDDVEGSFTAPVFPFEGNNFRTHVQKTLRYPYDAMEDRVDGMVMTQFIIDESGRLSDVCVTESVCPTLDREVIRTIRKSPIWEPAKLDGKPIKIMIEMPIVFLIQ